ncbi:MAG: YncE family protein [Coriobacteriia bacterium]|nr:YncE family protein [Coriobacteriia bacterium]
MRISLSRSRGLGFASLTLLLALTCVVPAASAGDSVIATVPVGDGPIAIALNPLSHHVFVANYNAGDVSLIDGVTDTYEATIGASASKFPIAVVVDHLAPAPVAFVGNFWTGTIDVLDEGSRTITQTVPVGASHGGGPLSFAVDMASTPHRLFAAIYGRREVRVYDAGTMSQIATVPVGNLPRSMALYMGAGDTQRLYILNRADNTVTVVNASTYAVIGTVPVGAGAKAVAVDQDSGNAYATAETSSNVTVIGPAATVLATVDVGATPRGLIVDASRDRLFVCNAGGGTVSVISTTDFSHIATLTVGTQPQSPALDEVVGKLYVANYQSDTVSIIDASLTVSTVPVGLDPSRIAVDAANTPHKAYVTNTLGDSVSVIDEPAPAPTPAPAPLGPLALPLTAPLPGVSSPSYAPPVELVVDSSTPGPDGSLTVTGRAIDVRTPVALPIQRVYWRLPGETAWRDVEILSGLGTITASWRIVYTPAAPGTTTIEVSAIDAAGATSSNCDTGGDAGSLSQIAVITLGTASPSEPPTEPPSELPNSGVSVGRPLSPHSVRHGRPFLVFGTLSARHRIGTRPVTLLCYRSIEGVWTLVRRVPMRIVRSGRMTRYAGYVRLPAAGRWRLIAQHADVGKRPDVSPARSMRVR